MKGVLESNDFQFVKQWARPTTISVGRVSVFVEEKHLRLVAFFRRNKRGKRGTYIGSRCFQSCQESYLALNPSCALAASSGCNPFLSLHQIECALNGLVEWRRHAGIVVMFQ